MWTFEKIYPEKKQVENVLKKKWSGLPPFDNQFAHLCREPCISNIASYWWTELKLIVRVQFDAHHMLMDKIIKYAPLKNKYQIRTDWAAYTTISEVHTAIILNNGHLLLYRPQLGRDDNAGDGKLVLLHPVKNQWIIATLGWTHVDTIKNDATNSKTCLHRFLHSGDVRKFWWNKCDARIHFGIIQHNPP